MWVPFIFFFLSCAHATEKGMRKYALMTEEERNEEKVVKYKKVLHFTDMPLKYG